MVHLVTMDKLLLTLTLVAFSSGVLCNAEQNHYNETRNITGPGSSTYKLVKVCMSGDVRDDFVVVHGMGAYKLHSYPMVNWNDARKICMDEGGELPIIQSNAEAKMLVDWLSRENVWETWIGTHDMFEQGHWVTLKGEPLEKTGFDHWLPGEPDNAGGVEHCGVFVRTNGMNDLTCNSLSAYFCKINLC